MTELENTSTVKAKDVEILTRTTLYDELGINYTLQLISTGQQLGSQQYVDIYHIVDTRDAVIIERNRDLLSTEKCYDSVRIEYNFFSNRREFSALCRKAAHKYGLTLDVVIAIGPENAEEFAYLTSEVSTGEWQNDVRVTGRILLNEDDVYVIQNCDFVCRKNVVLSLLSHASKELKIKISNATDMNLSRIASYLLAKAGLQHLSFPSSQLGNFIFLDLFVWFC